MQRSIVNSYALRNDFPIFKKKINGKELVYLDNASTTQKPYSVIDSITDFYTNYNSNIHRAVYQLAEEATELYEQSRKKIANFINACPEEIVFTRNTTESINLIAHSWARSNLKKDDGVVITELEHHSNIVPWQILCQEIGTRLEYVGIDENGFLDLEHMIELISSKKVKLVSLSHMSNVLGTIVPIERIIKIAHEHGIPVIVDGAQSVPHMPVNVKNMDCDFLVFSAHKMLGPTGVGVLYAKKELLENMRPFMGGGDMIKEVFKFHTNYNEVPYKFEAGTPNIADVVGYGAAIDYLEKIGMENIRRHEISLTEYALESMLSLKYVTVYGPRDPKYRGGVISFNIADIHPHDLATIMNDHGIAIRSGHHCAQVLMQRLDVPATSRASFYIYNTKEEIDKFVNAIKEAGRIFKI
ncbi:MAG: cysteine desulfurase [Nitrososphaeraceae archaeon]|jgi:cysteine desulfurase/selenocysteine lyase|nr:cysteine desulfurase [Nitrososphaeraceae archaeon]MDW0136226.1 cysteine desulfurase [Nitrososphaeraceae archaeon]MDW0138722.1 cysteine desulfurase [Nitrososphaeraceae archaeon]MDW0145184.1 cysteine desulfurase [Nitrososphaeraceae archaeon]MDW0151476.1 cysteine desulfurase [Nitrososphaeraceae archaeon]